MLPGLTRRDFHRFVLGTQAGWVASPEFLSGASPGSPFAHPGILHTETDF
jgi:hypothetical protein